MVLACKLNESGIVASVQLLQTMATRWSNRDLLDLLQRAKDLVFGSVRHAVVSCEAVDNTPDGNSENGRSERNRRKLCEDFSQQQLQETFRLLSEWMDVNFTNPLRTVESLGHELQV